MTNDMERQQCRICGNTNRNRKYRIRERMLNQGEEFNYLLCSKCGVLQLIDEIDCMDKYYDNYPVFELKNKYIRNNWLKQWYIDMMLSTYCKGIKRIPCIHNELSFLDCLVGTGIKRSDKILDVGCGNGRWLQQLESVGFDNLYGVDKYVPNKMLRSKCIFCKGEIYNLSIGKFDLITLHHSFEHMQNPERTLKKIKSLLNETGILIIRIPVMGKIAWKKYKTNWYQIDAPRHFFLYTEKALKMICEREGLEIYNVKYDSQYGQFFVSEQYGRCKRSFRQICQMGKSDEIKKYKKWAKIVNRKNEGDQAVFYIRKKSN